MGVTSTTSMAISCMWAWMIPHFYIEFSEYRLALEKVSLSTSTSSTTALSTTAALSRRVLFDSSSSRSDANKATVRGVCAAILIIMFIYIGSTIGIGILTKQYQYQQNQNQNNQNDIDEYFDIDDEVYYETSTSTKNDIDDDIRKLTKADAIIIGVGRMLSACLLAYFSVELPRWLGVTYSSQKHVEYYKQALITITVIIEENEEEEEEEEEDNEVVVEEVVEAVQEQVLEEEEEEAEAEAEAETTAKETTATTTTATTTATTTTTTTSSTVVTSPSNNVNHGGLQQRNNNNNNKKNNQNNNKKNNQNQKKNQIMKKNIIGLKELSFRVCWSFLGHFFIMYPFLVMYFCNVKFGNVINSTFIGITFGFSIVYFVWLSHTKLNYKQRTYVACLLSLIIVLSSSAAFSAGCWYVKEVWYGNEEYTNEYTVTTFCIWTFFCLLAHYVYYRLTQRKLVEHAVSMGVTTTTGGGGGGGGGEEDRRGRNRNRNRNQNKNRNRNVRRNYNGNNDTDSITYTVGGRRYGGCCYGNNDGEHQQTMKRDEVQKVKGEWRYGQSHIFQPPKSINCVANELGDVMSPRIKKQYAKFKQKRQRQHRRQGQGRSGWRRHGRQEQEHEVGSSNVNGDSSNINTSLEDDVIVNSNDEDHDDVVSPTILDFDLDSSSSSSSLPTRNIRDRIDTEATFKTTSTIGSNSDVDVDDNTDIDYDIDIHIVSSLDDDSKEEEEEEEEDEEDNEPNRADTATTDSHQDRLLEDMVAGNGMSSPISQEEEEEEQQQQQQQQQSDTTVGINIGALVDVGREERETDLYENVDDGNLSVPSDVDDVAIHREEKENPTLWYMMKANSCCRRRRYYNVPPRKGCDLFINIFKWSLYAAAAWMHVGFTIICIGASLEQNTVRDSLDGTFELLYPSNYKTGPMCAWNNTDRSSTKANNANADIRTFDSLEDVYASNYSVIHCGECGHCSNWNDLSLQWTTRIHLAETAKDCTKEILFGGTFEDVQDCNEKKIGFTEECSTCWTIDQMCAKDNCFFIFLQSVFTNQVNNFNVGPDDITSATCDEALCGPEFVPCSGATRRRMNIESDIPRPAIQQCNVVKEDWSVVFDHLE